MPTPEEIMKFVDTNEDGNIDWFEYGAALAKLCEKHNYEPSGWDYATATALYLYTDVNRNGLVSFKELERMYAILKKAGAFEWNEIIEIVRSNDNIWVLYIVIEIK